MSSNRTDISQIKQYLNGELDARAMHELEKRAQQDPFLQDALDGYEAAAPNQEPALTDLQQRLQQRVGNHAQRSLIPWPLVGIAASVVLVSLVGWLLYRLNHRPSGAPLAYNVVPATAVPDTLKAAAPKPAVPLTFAAPKSEAQQLAAAPVQHQLSSKATVTDVLKSVPRAQSDENAMVRIDEPVGNAPVSAVVAEDSVQKVASNGYFDKHKPEILGGKANLKTDSQHRMVNQILKGKVDGVMVETEEGQHPIAGTLLDGIGGQPLANAMVRLKDYPKKTFTDIHGNFSITAKNKDVLVMSSIGYLSQEVAVGKRDSLNIALQPDSKALAEVAVVGYGTKKTTTAAPAMGREAYRKYLANATSPDRKTGKVRLGFTVQPDGKLTDFKVLSSVSKAADVAAINKVKNGPAWHAGTQHTPEQVTLEIDFH